MWNNLKSDFYRISHSRYFYIIIGLTILTTFLIFFGGVIQSNTPFASFNVDENTFVDFLYFTPKTVLPALLALILIGMFTTDEHMSGYIKNIYPLQTHKWKYVVERYIFSVLIITVVFLVSIVTACVTQVFQSIPFGTINMNSYILYFIVQVFILSAVAAFINMLIYATKSRVLAILLAVGYSSMFIYMVLFSICNFMFDDAKILEYTMYVLSGQLPYIFSLGGYQTAVLVTLGNTVLYTGISTILLYKKDIK